MNSSINSKPQITDNISSLRFKLTSRFVTIFRLIVKCILWRHSGPIGTPCHYFLHRLCSHILPRVKKCLNYGKYLLMERRILRLLMIIEKWQIFYHQEISNSIPGCTGTNRTISTSFLLSTSYQKRFLNPILKSANEQSVGLILWKCGSHFTKFLSLSSTYWLPTVVYVLH